MRNAAPFFAPALIVTVHPSAVPRADDGEPNYRMLVSDLRLVIR